MHNIRMGKTVVGALAAVACVVAIAGCGNITTPVTSSSAASDATASSSAPAVTDPGAQYASAYKANGTATITAGQPLAMTMGTMDFQPNTLTVAKGTAVTLQIHNTSGLAHNFSLGPFHVDQNVDPGQSVTVTFTPDQSGTFYFYCNVPGHAAAGMVGKITVQ